MPNSLLRFVAQVKAGELFKHPVWKSSWFVFGLVAMGFGLWGIIFSSNTNVPAVDELKTVKGKFNKLEAWTGRRGGTAYILYLNVNGEDKRFNVNRCQDFLKFDETRTLERQLKPDDSITIYVDDSYDEFRIVDGAVWQILKNKVKVCSYSEVVAYMRRSDEFSNNVTTPFMLIIGSLMVALGLYRTKLKGAKRNI